MNSFSVVLLLAFFSFTQAITRVRVSAPQECFMGADGLKLRHLLNENFQGLKVWSDCSDECHGTGSNMTCYFCTPNHHHGHVLLVDDALTGLAEGKDILSCDTSGISASAF